MKKFVLLCLMMSCGFLYAQTSNLVLFDSVKLEGDGYKIFRPEEIGDVFGEFLTANSYSPIELDASYTIEQLEEKLGLYNAGVIETAARLGSKSKCNIDDYGFQIVPFQRADEKQLLVVVVKKSVYEDWQIHPIISSSMSNIYAMWQIKL